MDAHRFDALARALSPGSRRGLLGTFLTLPVLGGLLAFLGIEETDAKGRRKRRKKRHKHGKGNGRHRKGKRRNKCKRKSRAKICRGKCGTVKNRKTCKKKVDCGACVACSVDHPCPNGCCAEDGRCQPGTTNDICGAVGESCQPCEGDTPVCGEGTCVCGDVCAGDCPFTTIQAAIDAAQEGATIRLCAETYQETIAIAKNLTLRGVGPGEDGTVLDGGQNGSVIKVGGSDNVTLEGLRITGGNSELDGGGIRIGFDGGLILTNCTVTGNTAELEGGGITVGVNGTATLTNSSVTGNTAGARGGGINVEPNGTVILNDSTVTGNTAEFVGGGFYSNLGSQITLNGTSSVTGNSPDNCAGVPVPGCSG